jgi:hypothetical protein
MDDKGFLKISPPGRGGPWVGVRSPPKSAEIAHETGTNQPVFVCEIFGLESHHRGDPLLRPRHGVSGEIRENTDGEHFRVRGVPSGLRVSVMGSTRGGRGMGTMALGGAPSSGRRGVPV